MDKKLIMPGLAHREWTKEELKALDEGKKVTKMNPIEKGERKEIFPGYWADTIKVSGTTFEKKKK